MKKYLEDTQIRLQITNFGVVYGYEGPKKEDNDKNLKILEEEFAKVPERFQLVKESVIDIHKRQELDPPICMLDMRG